MTYKASHYFTTAKNASFTFHHSLFYPHISSPPLLEPLRSSVPWTAYARAFLPLYFFTCCSLFLERPPPPPSQVSAQRKLPPKSLIWHYPAPLQKRVLLRSPLFALVVCAHHCDGTYHSVVWFSVFSSVVLKDRNPYLSLQCLSTPVLSA